MCVSSKKSNTLGSVIYYSQSDVMELPKRNDFNLDVSFRAQADVMFGRLAVVLIRTSPL